MTVIQVPGSKSVTTRALFLAAAAKGTSVLRHPLTSDDTESFSEGLQTLGYAVDRDSAEWTIDGNGNGPNVPEASVYCRDAATASRFLPVLAALGNGVFSFDASPQMRRRPVGPLIGALRALGVDVQYNGQDGHLPFTVMGRGIAGGQLTLDAGISSQFLTAVLLGGPLMRDGLTVTVTDLVSVPYVEITMSMMSAFGVDVIREGNTFHVPAQPYRAVDYAIEPDASTASYFLATAAVTGRTITVPGLGTASMQGDVRFAEVLAGMGVDVRMNSNSITVSGPDHLDGITANMRDISDTMPTLAAIAPFASGTVRIEDVYNTRLKECDRLEACASNLAAMGIRVETGRDWIQIWPGEPTAAQIQCHGDHRIAMSFSIAGLRTQGLTLDDPGCVRKTFPEFHEVLASLRTEWGT